MMLTLCENKKIEKIETSCDRLQSPALQKVSIHDGFWADKLRTNLEITIPYLYQMYRKMGHIDAFKLDWAPGKSKPHFFWDSDVAKWLEAVAYSLASEDNNELENLCDSVIDVIASAQQPDGYLNSYFTAVEPQRRWKNIRDSHELYCAGHLIEAAAAYFQSTGKDKFLKVMCRYADYIATVFGTGENQLAAYPGHQEIELALVKLYKATGDEKYLDLAKYFIDQRGGKPVWFDRERQSVEDCTGTISDKHYTVDYTYNQAHLPVRMQNTAEGHSVRGCYMYSAMADIASQTNDDDLLQACERIWDDIVRHKMYITGGIGSAGFSERFTINGDLPNFEAYSETCASIALVFFAHRMFNITKDGQYTDVIEKALYNTIYGSVGVSGKSFFYANPLAEYPAKRNYEFKYQGKKYSCSTRQPWYDTSCCPSNIARLLASLGGYIYSVSDEEIYVNLYISSKIEAYIRDAAVILEQTTSYPNDGNSLFTIRTLYPFDGVIALRVPDWSSETIVRINGEVIETSDICVNGYVKIDRMWQDNDRIEIFFDMSVKQVRANSVVTQNAGRFAIQRGPIIYCIESIDNGENLEDIFVEKDTKFYVDGEIDAAGVKAIVFDAKRRVCDDDQLYSFTEIKAVHFKAVAVPYFYRSNRGESEMLVWIRENL